MPSSARPDLSLPRPDPRDFASRVDGTDSDFAASIPARRDAGHGRSRSGAESWLVEDEDREAAARPPPPPPPSYCSPYRVSYGSLNPPPPSYCSPYRVSYGSLTPPPPPSYCSPYRVSYGSLNPPPHTHREELDDSGADGPGLVSSAHECQVRPRGARRVGGARAAFLCKGHALEQACSQCAALAQVCKSPSDEAKMLLCDRCNDGSARLLPPRTVTQRPWPLSILCRGSDGYRGRDAR